MDMSDIIIKKMKEEDNDGNISYNLNKKSNESTYLPDKEKIKFHSIVLLELFPFEDFHKLIKGLDNLYGDLSKPNSFNFNASKIKEIKKELKNSTGFSWIWHNLPPISNSRFNEVTIYQSHDLGENIHHLNLGLFNISSTLVMVKIEVGLMSNISNKLNNILYREVAVEELVKYDSNTGITSRSFPAGLKIKEVSNLRYELKKEIIGYLLPFFNGYFFNLSKKDYSIVPSIDLISFKYPENNEDIIKWGNEHQSLLGCFGVRDFSNGFKYERYLICSENEPDYNEFRYKNHVIFANRNPPLKTDEEINEKIETYIQFTFFVLLAIYRLIQTYENIIRDLNVVISKEIQDLEENKLNEVLENRKKISKKIYDFKRFKLAFEFEEITFNEDFDFEPLTNKGNKDSLFVLLLKLVGKRIKEIDNAINTLNKNANIILNLKNIEYSENIGYWTKNLAVIVVFLTIIQIGIAVFIYINSNKPAGS